MDRMDEENVMDQQYANLEALSNGCVSGHFSEWPMMRLEASNILQERHKLHQQLSAANERINELEQQVERYKPYHDAVDDAMVCSHIGVATGNAKKDINDLATYEQGIGAYFGNKELQKKLTTISDKVRQETVEECCKLASERIDDDHCGGDWESGYSAGAAQVVVDIRQHFKDTGKG